MPDMAMCQATNNCPKKNKCYRYMAKPDGRCTYVYFEAICCEKSDWKYFYEIDGRPVKEEELTESSTENNTTEGEVNGTQSVD